MTLLNSQAIKQGEYILAIFVPQYLANNFVSPISVSIKRLYNKENNLKVLLVLLLVFVPLSNYASDYKPMDGYSKLPLTDPVFDYTKVIMDSAAFNNWLNANYSKLNVETMKGPREHLYYLLSSYVSELNNKDGVILPKENDLVLSTLLSWSEKLGAYGTHLFYNEVKSNKMEVAPPLMKISDGIKISAVNDMFKVESTTGGWSTTFPYYFMIGAINEFNATNGMATQLLTISTGAVKDKTKTGRSQSTLMLIYSPSNDVKKFSQYWLSKFEIDAKINANPLGVKKLESVYIYNKEALLHKEITFLPSSNGSLLIAYLGMDGAYQKNRPHFLDFISQVKTKNQ